jgi:glycopeptide antibiotics resistance protein
MGFSHVITTALMVAPLIYVIIAAPLLYQQYRRYGALSPWRLIVILSFVLYLLTAYFLVILPLPQPEYIIWLDAQNVPTVNLNPFQIVSSFLNENPIFQQPFTQKTLLAGLLDPSVTQVVFNVLMTVPFGFYLRYFFGLQYKSVLFWSIALTFFFELTQLSGLYGLYERPYRLFDVADLFLNTSGAMIGYGLTPLLQRMLPDLSAATQRARQKAGRISLVRRSVAFLVDVLLWQLFMLFSTDTWWQAVTFIGIFIGAPLLWGKTFGMQRMRYHIRREQHNRLPFVTGIARQVLGIGVPFVLIGALVYGLGQTGTIREENLNWLLTLIAIGTGILFIGVMDWLLSLLRIGRPLWYERLTRTHVVADTH